MRRNISDRVIGDVVVGFEASVGDEVRERGTAFEDVAERLGQLRLRRQLGKHGFNPGEEGIKQRRGLGAVRLSFG